MRTIKVIALGNILMGDDGVAIEVAQYLMKNINYSNIEILIGETDVDYCIENINEEDFLIILDATYMGHHVGGLSLINLESIKEDTLLKESQHNLNLLDLLGIYNKNNKGYFIGIKVKDIDYRIGLSKEVKYRFKGICEDIMAFILYFEKENTS